MQSNKKIGLLLADSLDDTTIEDNEGCVDGLSKKKAAEADMKLKRASDERVVAAFVHKSSLVDRFLKHLLIHTNEDKMISFLLFYVIH